MSPFFNFHTAIAINKVDVLEKLHNLMAVHSITIEEDSLIFSTSNESSATVIEERNQLRFIDIIYINDNSDFIDIVVRSGYLHILSTQEPKRAYLSLNKDLFHRSRLTLKEAVDTVHDIWQQMDEAGGRKA